MPSLIDIAIYNPTNPRTPQINHEINFDEKYEGNGVKQEDQDKYWGGHHCEGKG